MRTKLFLDEVFFVPDEDELIEVDEMPFDDEEVVQKVGNRTYLVLVIYDIVENKSRTKLAKELEGWGVRVQYSAFECHLTLSDISEMYKKLLSFIDPAEDSLRIYRMPATTKIDTIGKMGRTYAEDVVIL